MRDLKNYNEFMDFCGDALEPIVKICADKAVADAFRSKQLFRAVSLVCKGYRDEVAVVLAALEGVTVEEFREKFSPVEIPKMMMELLNSDEFKSLFPSAQQKNSASSFGNAQEVIPD